jgi:hypothetical protein
VSVREYAPPELLDPDGEGIYLLSDPRDGSFASNPYRRARCIFDCALHEIEAEAVSMIPAADGEMWLPVSFRNWRWFWPLSIWHEPVVYLYCTPPTESEEE